MYGISAKEMNSKLAKLLAKTSLNASQRNKSSSDIYGYRIGDYYKYGLVEATDESDLDIKFLSLKEKWSGLCPGFYDWLKKNADFVEHLNISDITSHGADSFHIKPITPLHPIPKISTHLTIF